MSEPQIERKYKDIYYLISVDFLDFWLHLKTIPANLMEIRIVIPFTKQNSSHPLHIIRDIPKSVCKRLSDSNQNLYETATTIYKTALKRSGFNDNFYYLQYNDPAYENSGNKIRENTPLFSLIFLIRQM